MPQKQQDDTDGITEKLKYVNVKNNSRSRSRVDTDISPNKFGIYPSVVSTYQTNIERSEQKIGR